MASGDTLDRFTPLHNAPLSTNYATLSQRGSHYALLFDATTAESAVFPSILPRNYAGGGVTVTIIWTTAATSGNAIWSAAFERIDTATDTDADSFASAQTSSASACSATSGQPTYTTIAFTHGAQMDSVAVGEAYRLKIVREAANGSDTINSNDLELHRVEVKET